jgi:hypothetical protein
LRARMRSTASELGDLGASCRGAEEGRRRRKSPGEAAEAREAAATRTRPRITLGPMAGEVGLSERKGKWGDDEQGRAVGWGKKEDDLLEEAVCTSGPTHQRGNS